MLSRREFIVGSAGAALAVQLPRRARTIQQVIDMIVAEIPNAPWEPTVDTIKSGDPSQPCTGIITTFLATQRVVNVAARHSLNLIITHEPTYYNHLDESDWLDNDPVYQAKRRVLDEKNIVIWRFHDYWHAYRPDGIVTGVLKLLGWEGYALPGQPQICHIPQVKLSSLSLFMKQRFGAQRLRVMGNPDLECTRVGLLMGAVGGQRQIEMLRDVDVLVAGEVREWETTEYVRDAVLQGTRDIGLIVVGHALSEEPGMKWLAEWLTPRVPGIRVVHQATGDPFYFV